ncbi:uncharacterized protein RJT21DRAFT_112787 [Scheffersomyces amazonensis]|uniref:uncharacterized protein n=1 Tax=Scheffersomyces amazonensis TaxID=1078765 RepID=UPI00315D4171
MSNLRRSISPRTVGDNKHGKNEVSHRKIAVPVSRLSNIVSYFKKPISRILGTNESNSENQSINDYETSGQPNKSMGNLNSDAVERMIIEKEPLNNDFTSIKKKRLSIQGHPSNESIPRSTTLNNNLGVYRSYYNSIQTSNEELNNDLERRLSTAYNDGIVKDGVNNSNLNVIVEQEFSRDASPLGLLPRVDTPISIQTVTSTTESVDDRTPISIPIPIDVEYAPLYQDNQGNIVRPPFINLDPRERYHLLQLKKSMQASQSLQNKIKYMIDPNETVSQINPSTNKVETSTQTHDTSYLNDSLVFKTKKRSRRITSTGSQYNIKRAKTGNKLFSGEFFYDVQLDTKKQQSNKTDSIINDIPKFANNSNQFSGYLGSVSKPTFSNKTNNEKRSSIDEDSAFNRFGNRNQKSTNQLNDSSNMDLTLDEDYLEKSKKISNIIKLKDSESLKNSENNSSEKKSVGPSSGFQFKINNDDINSIIESRKENEILIEKSKLSQQEPFKLSGLTKSNEPEETNKKISLSFGKPSTTEEKEISTPKFSFGSTTTTEKKDDTPKFSFGNNSTEKKDTPKFSFGTPAVEKKEESATKPQLNFGFKPTSSTPSLSFGKEANKPKVSVGISEETEDEPPVKRKAPGGDKSSSLFSIKPAEQKQDNSASTPLFSFGDKTKTSEDEPPKKSLKRASSSENVQTPKFSFDTNKKDDTAAAKPLFGLGNNTSKSTTPIPAFSLNGTKSDQSSKPISFGFGQPKPVDNDKDSNATTSGGSSGENPKPLFSFGDNAGIALNSKPSSEANEKNENSTKPTFSFGSTSKPSIFDTTTSSSKPTFSFGSTATTGEEKSTTKTPAFSFGEDKPNNTTTIATPSSNAQTSTSSTPFTFGNNGNSVTKPTIPNANPNFKFAPGISISDAPKPVLNFGATTTIGNSANGSSRSTTPVASSGGNTAPPAFSFGSSTSNINPASVFGNHTQPNTNAGASMFGATTKPGFNFGGGFNSRGSTPDAVFGGSGSREPTPFSFGATDNNNVNANNGMGGGLSMPVAQFGTPQPAGNPFGAPAQMGGMGGMVMGNMNPNGGLQSTPTPPLLKSRKIAQMRSRRR